MQDESEKRYRFMFEKNPMPMWVLDAETWKIVAVNEQTILRYGYTLEEFLSMDAFDLRPPEDRAALRAVLVNASSEPMPMQEWRHRKKDGTVFEVEITSHPIEWKGRGAILALGNDISRRKSAERDSQAMEVQLRHAQKLESIGQLAAGIAHEINTPTQYIGDNLHFLKDTFLEIEPILRAAAAESADLPYLLDEIPRAIDQAIEGVGRVSTLVRAMKEFSHPGQKEKTPANLNAAIQTTINIARNEWKYVARMETDFAPDLPLVPCLISAFNQVILNLIVNAAQAIGDTGAHFGNADQGTISISTRAVPDYVEIRISDTGGGIPDAVRERIFDPFFTTKEVGKGTGQGLAIARSVVVDKHGGTIHFETEIGKGTTFVIRLPLGESLTEAEAAA